jgi:hypothetical protein
MTGESDTRGSNQMENNNQHWMSPDDGLLLGRNASKQNKKIVHVNWEALYCLYIVNMHGTQNIKTRQVVSLKHWYPFTRLYGNLIYLLLALCYHTTLRYNKLQEHSSTAFPHSSSESRKGFQTKLYS